MHRIARVFLLFLGTLCATAQGPSVSKVDPPNWFSALPSPMLLVRGTGLYEASFTVAHSPVRVTRSVTSPNGHWAMVFLDTHAAQPGTFHVTVRTGKGTAAFEYTLLPRRTEANQPKGFSPQDVLYLIMPDRFADGDTSNDLPATLNRHRAHAYHGGDLKGVAEHLDYLQNLGVTSIWLTPILQNDPNGFDYHGYGATDMYAVDSRLGTLAEYHHLADELHRRGMKLIFDDVPNHIGHGHPWVEDPPTPDWFHGTAAHHLDNRYAFAPVSDPHAASAASLDALDGWFANMLPDMNQDNPFVAQYLTQNMVWWIEEVGIDGLRIDTFPYVQRTFWQGYLGELSSLYPRLTEVGEVEDGDPTKVAFFAGNRLLAGVDTHLTTPFDYPMYFKLMDVLVKGRPMSDLEDTFRQDWLYPQPQLLVPFLGNHDQPRFLSQPGASPALLRLSFGLLLTMRGTPQLYAGDEILMEGGGDPDNRRDFPGGFPGDPLNAFTAEGRTAPQNAMHDWVAAIDALRAHTPALQTGSQQTVFADTSGFAFLRRASSGDSACAGTGPASMLVVLNRSAEARTVDIPLANSSLAGCKVATPALGDGVTKPAPQFTDTSLNVDLPAFGFAVYTLR